MMSPYEENRIKIEHELAALCHQIYPLQRKQWKLIDQLNKAKAAELLAGGVLESMSWRLRISGLKPYLQYERDSDLQLKGKRWPDIMDVIIPYPHSHFTLSKGVTLNQDDGDVTISFDTLFLLRKFLRLHNLKVLEWKNLTTLLNKIRPYRSLLKQLQSKEGGAQ